MNSATAKAYTVKKLRSINLLFSGMFLIEHKIFNIGAGKYITLIVISSKFTLICKILELLLLVRKITQFQIKKFFRLYVISA
jgi:hypothetical protein